MKHFIRYCTMTTLILMAVTSLVFAQNRKGQKQGQKQHQNNSAQCIIDMPMEELSELETKSLLLMREEEKLARDVYLVLYEKWGTLIFSNIATSEQQHTDRIKVLLDKYELEDPFVDEPGVFSNKELAALYEQLTAKGEASLVEALTVGMTIEDLDIYDLQQALLHIDNRDIRFVFQNLMKGSRNHLRAFHAQLSAQAGSYAPQFISVEDYDTILASEWERGAVDEDGNPTAQNNNRRGGKNNKGYGKNGHGKGHGNCNGNRQGNGSGECVNPTAAPIKADNYPNPANPGTTIRFALNTPAATSISIYNSLGKVVRRFYLGHRTAGEHLQQWNALDNTGQPVATGLYFYRIQAGDISVTNRLLLVQ